MVNELDRVESNGSRRTLVSELACGKQEFDRKTLDDYVAVHGCGVPTKEGYALAREMLMRGDDYPTIAHEIVFRQLTIAQR